MQLEVHCTQHPNCCNASVPPGPRRGNNDMRHSSLRSMLAYATACLALTSVSSADEESVSSSLAGRWRFELGGATGLYSGSVDRRDDYFFTGSFEYEFPAAPRVTMGLRAYPLFLYHQSDHDDLREQDSTIYGLAAGFVFRMYQNERKLTGLYGEIGTSLMWHTDHFHRNDSRWNFFNEGGIGYHFENNWQLALKYQHISNGGITTPNSGINALSLVVGITF